MAEQSTHTRRRDARGCVLPATLLAAAIVTASCTAHSRSTAPPSATPPTTASGRVRLIAKGGLLGLLDRERRSSRRQPSTQPSGSTTTDHADDRALPGSADIDDIHRHKPLVARSR